MRADEWGGLCSRSKKHTLQEGCTELSSVQDEDRSRWSAAQAACIRQLRAACMLCTEIPLELLAAAPRSHSCLAKNCGSTSHWCEPCRHCTSSLPLPTDWFSTWLHRGSAKAKSQRHTQTQTQPPSSYQPLWAQCHHWMLVSRMLQAETQLYTHTASKAPVF